MAQANNNSNNNFEWEAYTMLDAYIHDYFLKRNLQASAKAFQQEAQVSTTDPVAIDAPGGFLLEWWSVFWDIFITRTNQKHSEAAASYLKTQMIKARELQIQQQQQQQQQHPRQKSQAQQQAHQLLLQRHAQQQLQQKDLSTNTGLNPVGFLDTLRRQPSGAASVLISSNTLPDQLWRDSLDIRSRLDSSRELSLGLTRISGLNLDPTGVQSHRQTVNATTGGRLQRVHNQNPPNHLIGQNKVSSVMDARSVVDNQEILLLGTHGLTHSGSNLTLNGWPLTGLNQLKSTVTQQMNSLPPYRVYLLQQHLNHAQKNMVLPSANLDKIRTVMDCKNTGIRRDNTLSISGDVMANAGSPTQASDAGLLNKLTFQPNLCQQLHGHSQLSVEQNQNSHAPDKDKMTDACLSNNSQSQASKIQRGRKRKMSTGPANSSGTVKTSGPSLSSVTSSPSTHTIAEAISMSSLSKNDGRSKASEIVASENTETLPSAVQHFVDKDPSLMDGPLEDNVESFLSPDMGDSAGTRVAVNEGFTFDEFQAIPVSTKLECCAFSSDGKLLASGGQDTKVVIWCTESFTMKSVLDEHTLMITDVRFSPTKLRVATSSADQTIKVWDADTPTYSLRTFTGHSAAVTSLDFHPWKDDLIYSADANGEIRCWSISNGCCQKVFQCDVTYIRFQPRHGRFFAGASDDGVFIVDSETQSTRLKLKGHKKQVTCLCWDFTGQYLASLSVDVARVWSFVPKGNGECIHEFSSTRTDFQSCCFHPTYSFLLIIGCDQMLELWNMVENKMMAIPSHEGMISALANSNVANLVVSASSDGFIKLWK